MIHDVIIVGGGPAGLSAALILARCRRRVLLIDDGHPRNAAASHMHGYLSRDGIEPRELLRLGRAELRGYGVEMRDARVVSARCCAPLVTPPPAEASADSDPSAAGAVARTGFEVTLDGGPTSRSRKLLLATGVADQLPGIPGFREFYGRGVHHCPYCDGYEYADRRLVAFGRGNEAAGLALSLGTWSSRLTVCTHGSEIDAEHRRRLARLRIPLRQEHVTQLEGDDRLRRVVFASGPAVECDAVFFNTDQVQRSALPAMLGCEADEEGQIVTGDRQHTCVSGLYLAGDADGDVQFVIVAAAEGASAAVAINRDLQDEDRAEAGPIADAWRFRD